MMCVKSLADDNSCKAGNPVSPGSGEKFHDEVDYSGAGAHPLEFSRSYRSLYKDVPRMAYGWRHNWQRNIESLPTATVLNSTAVARRHDGTHSAYKYNGAQWVAQTGGRLDVLTEVLTNGVRTGWRLKIWENDSTEHYDALGQLKRVVQRNGWTNTITYSTKATPIEVAPDAGLPIAISNHFGRTLGLRYNLEGKLIKLIDPAGGEIKYSYELTTQGITKLTKVTWQDNTFRSYLYQGYSSAFLAGIVDEMGVRIGTYTYDDQGRVYSSEKANGAEKLTFLYNADKSTSITDYTPSPTGVGAPTATTRTHRFGYAQGVVRPVSVRAPCPVCGNTAASTAYDANGNVNQRTEHDGTVTKFTYDVKNRETSRIEAFGTAAAKTYITQWHATWNLPMLRTEPLKITAYTYDAKGNLTGQAETPTTDASGVKGVAGVRDVTQPVLSSGWFFDSIGLLVNAVNKSASTGQAVVIESELQVIYTATNIPVSVRNLKTNALRAISPDIDYHLLQILQMADIADPANAVTHGSLVAELIKVKKNNLLSWITSAYAQKGGKGRSPIYRCTNCNAPHGGVRYPLCPSCYDKLKPPSLKNSCS